MRWHPRERASTGTALLLALAVLSGCRGGGEPAASGTPSPVVTSTAPSPTPSPTPPARPFVIGVIGDYGVDKPPVRQVVKLMRGFNGGKPLAAVVTTGDNAYGAGRPAEATFAAKALAPLLSLTPLYAALGNHDAATADGRHVMASLRMPARWYTARVGPVELVVLDSTRTTDPKQLAFLRGVLARPRAGTYRVVVFHHPPVSCSLHGPDATVAKTWVPLFGDKVDLVLMGHNHTYERFTADNGLTYVTTGGGGAGLYPSIPGRCKGPAQATYVRTVHHAVRLTATTESLKLEGIGLDGKAFDTVSIEPRR